MFFYLFFLLFLGLPIYSNQISNEDNKLDQQDYITRFPFEQYTIVTVPNQGKFYVEPQINDCIKNVLKQGKPWDLSANEYIKKYGKPGTTFLDIGAHIGTQTLIMSQVAGKNGLVIAFEPQKKIYRELIMNMQLNDISNALTLNCALSNKTGFVSLGEEVPNNEGARFVCKTGKEKVPAFKLDDFQLDNISFIKIDVENYELEVLEGAKETIKRNRPVMLIEIQGNTVAAKANEVPVQPRAEQTKKLLKELGYKVSFAYAWEYIAIP